MRGAIAAGHRVTAETGARVLAAGGNAVDACVAAAFASWVAESTLTGPGGGGFMLVHRARDRGARLLDFFVAVPGRGLPPHERAAMQQVDVDFDRATSQVFHIGAASVGVPGTPAGLQAAYRAYGTKPWPELVAPAVELAREGIELPRPQADLHAVRDPGAPPSEPPLPRSRLVGPRPVGARFLGHEFLSNPPPSSGGVLIAYGLRLLDRLGLRPASGSAEEIATLAEVMREQTRARGLGFASGLYRGGLARRLLADEAVEAGTARVRARLAGLAEPVGMPGTTQISVVDARGNAASMTASTGAGSGVIVPGTGVHLNNMLGEYDLVAASARPGMRLTSMMAGSSPRTAGEAPATSVAPSARSAATRTPPSSSPRTRAASSAASRSR